MARREAAIRSHNIVGTEEAGDNADEILSPRGHSTGHDTASGTHSHSHSQLQSRPVAKRMRGASAYPAASGTGVPSWTPTEKTYIQEADQYEVDSAVAATRQQYIDPDPLQQQELMFPRSFIQHTSSPSPQHTINGPPRPIAPPNPASFVPPPPQRGSVFTPQRTGIGKRIVYPGPLAGTSRGASSIPNVAHSEFPNFSFGGVASASARGTSVLKDIDMDYEYLGFDNIYDLVASQGRTQVGEEVIQSARKPPVTVDVPESDSPPSAAEENVDDDTRTFFPTNILVADNCSALLRENIMNDIDEMRTWEIRAKTLIKEINERYHNFSHREELYALVKNEPTKIDALLSQAQSGSYVISNNYNDSVLNIVINRLTNLNAEAQAYYNKWSRDKKLVAIARAEKDLAQSKYQTLSNEVQVLDEHLKKARDGVKGAIAFKKKLNILNKQNNTLRRIIKEHGLDPKILLKIKEDEDPTLLSPGDAAKEDKQNLENINVAAKELVQSGVIKDSLSVEIANPSAPSAHSSQLV